MSKRKINNPLASVNDMVSGARTYNRLEMQISQAVLLTIEFYPQTNFVIVMDYYDDIVVFDDEIVNADAVFYQMKTDATISMSAILREEWLPKLYNHLLNPQFVVKELALITQAPITYRLDNGSNKRIESPRTAFSALESEIQEKIKMHIAEKNNIDIASVDLSKFCHIRTTLSVAEHRVIAEQKFSNFLFDKNDRIDVKAVKTIFGSLIQLLTQKQSFELAEGNPFDEVLKHKSIVKMQVDKIVDGCS